MVLKLTVADVMTQPLLSVTADTPLQDAVRLISDHHISGLPVVDAKGALVPDFDLSREGVLDKFDSMHDVISILFFCLPAAWSTPTSASRPASRSGRPSRPTPASRNSSKYPGTRFLFV